jgi:hypothetical protein
VSTSAKHDAVTAFVQDCEADAIVTKFVIVAEVIGIDGRRSLWTDTNDDATPWDSKGLLVHALEEMCGDE